jgi:hypothetical protein
MSELDNIIEEISRAYNEEGRVIGFTEARIITQYKNEEKNNGKEKVSGIHSDSSDSVHSSDSKCFDGNHNWW